MYVSLLILGVIVTLSGAAMLAFGIPINEFGLGNTLIVAGTVAFVGGLILIGVSESVRQLRRIAHSLARPVGQMPRGNDLFEPVSQGAPPAGPRIPFPPKPEPRRRMPTPAMPAMPAMPVMPPEPRLDAAPSLAATDDHLDRSPSASVRSVPEPRVVPERDEAPLSPQAEPRFAAVQDEKDELAEGLLATAFSRLDAELRNAPPAAEPANQDDMFEPVRPPELRKDFDVEPAQSPAQAETEEHEQPAEEPRQEEQPEEPYAVSILKSGVVDGMAYTLYSDGSIEAEMPEGTMRFASIMELRAYLEKASS